ncbi:MAG: RdgB/HAM1 family non-canonical purine NTP pyrophosphatase [Kiritimatiellae bacterium]|nr:RdgB/HAM1 family non-canonical purine NTP pyrophosphatase [Kiritimatiellia bacterium]
MKLLIATRNPDKLAEMRALLNVPGLHVLCINDIPQAPEVEEDGFTFEENALKKATVLARATGLWALADDSGLEVAALGGIPGVHSARYAGEPVKYSANNEKLIAALREEPDRRAQFRTVIALSSPAGVARTVEGRCAGVIVEHARGQGGFGYDPLFQPEGYSQTFAEMSSELKNKISHRAHALARAKENWPALFSSDPVEW